MHRDEPLYAEPPAALARPRVRHLLGYLGPGVIIASVTIGSGELVWASRSGAIFGYSMLWCFLYAGLFKAIQVYTAARHITLTGEHPIVDWARLPGPPCWFPLLIALPAVALMPIAFSAIPETLAGFIHRLTGMPEDGMSVAAWKYQEFWVNVWSTVVLSVCLGLALLSSYLLLERVSTVVLGLMVVCVGVSVFALGPSWGDMLSGLFVPRVAEYPAWLLANPKYVEEFQDRSPWLEVSIYLGAVGGGAYDYIGYIGMLREKRWGLAGKPPASIAELEAAVAHDSPAAAINLERARQWTRGPLFDTVLSFFFVILVTLLFAILGTLVLHSTHKVPANNDLLNQQEIFLTNLHPELRWVYRGGVFLAFIGTLYGAFEVYRYTFVESISAVVPRWATPNRVPLLRRIIVAYCFCGGLLMVWLPTALAGNIVQRLTFGSVISGAAACGLWCFAMLWVDRVRLPPPLRMNLLTQLLTVVAGVAMTFLGIQTAIAYFR